MRNDVARPRPVVIYARDPNQTLLWCAAVALLAALCALVFVGGRSARAHTPIPTPRVMSLTSAPAPTSPESSEAVELSEQPETPPRAVQLDPDDPPLTAPPQPRVEATRQPYGSLDIIGMPNAEVLLEGYPIGRTPLRGLRLPAGTHGIEVRGGGEIKALRVRIRSGERTETVVRLAKPD